MCFPVFAQILMTIAVHFQNLKLIEIPNFYCTPLPVLNHGYDWSLSLRQPAVCIGLHLNIRCRLLNYCILMQTPYGIQCPKNINHFPKLLIPCTSELEYYKPLQLQQLLLKHEVPFYSIFSIKGVFRFFKQKSHSYCSIQTRETSV